MKQYLLFVICVITLFSSCAKPVKEKPFDVRDVDSVTVKDGADNPVKLSIKYLLDSAYNDIFKSEEELNQFFDKVVWNLKNECTYPQGFKPTNIINFAIYHNPYQYKGEKIYHLHAFVECVVTNGFGVVYEGGDILDLIAWREKDIISPEEEHIYWHVMPNETYFENCFKEDIDKKLENK